MSDREKSVAVLKMVMDDIESDVQSLDGKPFTGETIATQFGNLSAAVQTVARILKEHLESIE